MRISNRGLAAVNVVLAFAIGTPCGATLYAVRSRSYDNYWVPQTDALRLSCWGLALCAVCLMLGVLWWRGYRFAALFEMVSAVPKVYCGWLFLYAYAISRIVLYVTVPVLLVFNAGLLMIFLWQTLKAQSAAPSI